MSDEQEFLQQTSTFCIHSLLRRIAAGCLSLDQSLGSLKRHTHVHARADTVIYITWVPKLCTIPSIVHLVCVQVSAICAAATILLNSVNRLTRFMAVNDVL